jgi:hypothetical protein
MEVDEAKDGKCTVCGRRCGEVPTEELRDWIVDAGGVVICASCCALTTDQADHAAVEPVEVEHPRDRSEQAASAG